MTILFNDLQYSDSCSESESSGSSFSSDPSTPASSNAYSVAASRRHSLLLESYSPHGTPRSMGSSFSNTEQTSNLGTPPSLQMQGYKEDCSSIYQQQPNDLPFRVQCKDSFAAHGSFMFSTPHVLGEDARLSNLSGDGSTINPGLPVDWEACFSDGIFQPHNPIDSTTVQEQLGFSPPIRFENDFGPTSFNPRPHYTLFHASESGVDYHQAQPETISPRETFVSPSTSLLLPESLDLRFETSVIKAEPSDLQTLVMEIDSPYRSECEGCEEDMESDDEAKVNLDLAENFAYHPPKTQSKNSKKRPRRSGESQTFGGVVFNRVTSEHKKHICEPCGNRRFDRPEHFKRHMETLEHKHKMEQLGLFVPNKDAKPYKCKIDGCEIKTKGVTRHDNLKPHYAKTHFYDLMVMKDGRWVENKKRNQYVSPEDAQALDLGHWDPRTPYGQQQLTRGKARL